MESAKIIKISEVTDKISKLYGETVLRLDTTNIEISTDFVDIVPSADYVYGFNVINGESKISNYYIDFKKKFKTQLGAIHPHFQL